MVPSRETSEIASKFILMTSHNEVNEHFQLGRLNKHQYKGHTEREVRGEGGMIRVEWVVSGRWL
jgi:hypothetical protein